VSTTPALADTNRMEIWPAWSPDGRTLYYCSSPRLDTYVNPPGSPEPFAYDRIRYDLMRIAYDPESGAWGRPETVLSSADADASVLEPRVSPDGRFILVTVSNYSQFPIYLKSADLALVDAATGRWRRLESNSDRADAFHSWSSNGRWIVFASKRADGLFSRPYFSHIDEKGAVSRPFVLPQEDPLFYGTFLENYNAPELSTEAISISPRALSRAAFDDKAAIAAEPLRGKPPAAPKR
jgi:dipeptidyl aminopeptidase/acylaminoacyl peptidase